MHADQYAKRILDGAEPRPKPTPWPPSSELATGDSSKKAQAPPPTALLRREAHPEHAVLKVHEYADVLASLIRSVPNDELLSFAILGPWGRGKTFLMRLVADQLRNHSYTTVVFSAWKYRTTPEIWSYLYETVYSHAARAGFAVPIRIGLLRHGIWPAVPALLMIALALLTFAQKIELASFIVSLFGFCGILYLLSVSRAIVRASLSLKTKYWDLPRHHHRLGLQCAIGDDLRELLMGWMPNAASRSEAWNAIFTRKPFSLVCLAVAVFAVWWSATEAVRAKAVDHIAVGWTVVLLLAGILLVVLSPLLVLVRNAEAENRVLLVVDDLDRCPPDQMLEVIECIQLFLDDKEVTRRLKVVMLVEEEVLRNALRRKYVDSLSITTDDHARISALVVENLEKLFLAWLRLEPLAKDETTAVFESVCASLVSSVPTDSTSRTADSNAVSKNNWPQMSEGERATIISMAKEIIDESQRFRWSPRAVRCFVFRFQLVRMVLEKLGREYMTEDIVRAIAIASEREVPGTPDNMNELLYRIARQVS